MPIPARTNQEQGGILILAALMILVLLTVTAFSLGRNTIRDLAISGTVSQAGRAETSADAGLDWFMAWTSEGQNGTEMTAGTMQATVVSDLLAMQTAPEYGAMSKKWSADLAKASTHPFVLQGTSGGGFSQAFNLELEFLGAVSGPGASGGKDVKHPSTTVYGWELTSQGQALVKTGSGAADYLRFQAVRAAKLDIR